VYQDYRKISLYALCTGNCRSLRGVAVSIQFFGLLGFQLDGSESASFLHERVAELEATAEKSKLKVNSLKLLRCVLVPA